MNVTVSFTTTEPVGDLTSARSGIDDTDTGPVVKESLVGFRSPGALTDTLLTWLGNAPTPTFTKIGKRTVVFAAIGPAAEHVTMSRPLKVPVTEHANPEPPEPVARYVSPVGSVSVTVIGPAWLPGDTFWTVIVQLAGRPITNAESGALLMPRSGEAMTAAGLSLPRSFVGFTSPGVLTRTVLVTLGSAAASTLTVSAMLALPAAAIGPALVHVTTCPVAAHAKPPPVPLAKVSPVGSVSVTVIAPVVADDPTLFTRIV